MILIFQTNAFVDLTIDEKLTKMSDVNRCTCQTIGPRNAQKFKPCTHRESIWPPMPNCAKSGCLTTRLGNSREILRVKKKGDQGVPRTRIVEVVLLILPVLTVPQLSVNDNTKVNDSLMTFFRSPTTEIELTSAKSIPEERIIHKAEVDGTTLT